MEDVERERQRAEVFDALGHPTRIIVLKALSEGSLGFSDLKKRIGIESSGHLQHHLGKLNGLIRRDGQAKYCLSDQGKDALFAVQTVERVLQPRVKEAEKLIHAFSLRTKAVLTLIIVLFTVASLVSGIHISSGGLMQSQYSYDFVKGTPLKEDAQQSLGVPYEIPPQKSFNYTAKVFFNPVGYGYAGSTYWILDMFLPPISNSTFHRQSFVGFGVEILASAEWMEIFFSSARGPSGDVAEEVINPYEFPPYNTKASTNFTETIGPTIPVGRTYIVPVPLEGDYTVSISNVGNSTVSGKITVWPSTVTMETKTLQVGEDLPVTFEAGSGRIARIFSKPSYPASTLLVATAVFVASPFGISALCIYLINRKR